MSANVTLIGRIGRLGELKTAAESNTQYLGFTCATSSWVPGKGGQDGVERATWWHVRIFGRQAEGLALRLLVGDLVEIRGSAELEEWTGNDGAKRQSLNVKADAVNRLTVRGKTTTAPTTAASPAADPGAYVVKPAPAPIPPHEEPPF